MKAIIFDLDNTLIDWLDEYKETIGHALSDVGVTPTESLIDNINSSIEAFDVLDIPFNKENLVNYINEQNNLNLDIKFMDLIEEYQGYCASYNEKLVDLIKYLSQKYDLYVVSNWFTKTQTKRLQICGIYDYFKGVFGGDKNVSKPNIHEYDIVLDKYKLEDIIVVGDSYTNDILPAIKKGIRVIWKTNEKRKDTETIKSIYELKDIL